MSGQEEPEAPKPTVTGPVGVVGAGLIGTSIGLALTAAGVEVLISDLDPHRAAAAAALGAGVEVGVGELRAAMHVVVAVPPAATAAVVAELLRLDDHLTVSDATSVKANVVAEVETMVSDTSRFCPGHPIAGRERGGPGAAQPELFENAVWVLCPGPLTSSLAVAHASSVARACGARVVELAAGEHDRALAVLSHVPQLVASVLAAQLPAAGSHGPELAGTGFRDTTRLADSDPELWTAITAANAEAVVAGLDAVARDIGDLAAALRSGDAARVRAALVAGSAARRTLPGKAAGPAPSWGGVGVVLQDRPGELARMLTAAGAAGVNVEDLAIEHAASHPVGYVDLAVAPDQVDTLLAALGAAGWHAHRTR